jgi:dihydroorotate dehydrogenase electron transfer subunit
MKSKFRARMERNRMNLPQVVHIREIQDDTRNIRTFVLDAEVPDAEPGQFIMLWLPGLDEKPLAIACPDPLTVTVSRVGPFSTALHAQRVGSQVGWRGPYGKGFSLHEDRSALLVAGGYGVAPLYFLANRALESQISTSVVLGAHTALDLPYVERFRALGVELITATDDGSTGHRGYVTDAILHSGVCNSHSAIYACGPEPMLVALHRLCLERDIPGQFSVERYMKCGFGVCGQCALDDLLVCQDGPVFNVEQLDGRRDFGYFQHTATGRRLPVR